MKNVVILPIWKKYATAAERFRELAMMAEEHPGKFERFVVLYEGSKEFGQDRVRVLSDGMELQTLIWMLEVTKQDAFVETK